jgi:hypothetical protein
MQNAFELASIRLAGEDSTGQDISAQAVTGSETLVPEGVPNLVEGRLTGFRQLPGDGIRVNDLTPQAAENFSGRGFPHADATG